MAISNDPNDPLAAAEAAADAQVSALQAQPLAPVPITPAPGPAPAPLGADGKPKWDLTGMVGAANVPAAPGGAQGAPVAVPEVTIEGQPDLAESARLGSASGGVRLPAVPGAVVTQAQVKETGTPGQKDAQAGLLGSAQRAEQEAVGVALQEDARNRVMAWATKMGRETLERQRVEQERAFVERAKERTLFEMQQISNGEADPMRVFKGEGGAWPVISTLLTMGLGLISGGLAGAGMFLAIGLQRAIADDVSEQHRQRSGRFKFLADLLGDDNLALQRLRAEQQGIVAMQAETIAAEEEARASFSRMKPFAVKLRADHAREAQKFAQDHQTHVTSDVVTQEYLRLKAESETTGMPLNPESTEERRLMIENGLDPDSTAAMSRYMKYVNQLKEAAPHLGAIYDARAIVNRLSAGEDVPGLGVFDEAWNSSRLLATDAGMQVMQPIRDVIDSYARKRSGAAIPEPEFERLRRIVAGRGTRADLMRGLDIIQSYTDREIKALNVGFPAFERIYVGTQQILNRRAYAEAERAEIKQDAPRRAGFAAAKAASSRDDLTLDDATDAGDIDDDTVDDELANYPE